MNNIKVLKLVSGETIVADIESNDTSIIISKPIQFTLVPKGSGAGTLMASEWIQTEEEVFTLRCDHVVAIASPTESLRGFYLKSVNEFVSDKTQQKILENLIQELDIKSTMIH